MAEMNAYELFSPTDRQREFLAAVGNHQYTLFGGGGGGGKSYILRWTLIALLLEWAIPKKYGGLGLTGVVVGLFSSTYGTLTDRQISKIAREVPMWLGTVRDSKEYGLGLHLTQKYGGGVMILRNLDKPEKYKSVEMAACGVEELTEVDEQTFDDLRFRLRWPGIEHTKFIAATNPNGPGHLWVKNLWINHIFQDQYISPVDLRGEFAFIRSLVDDNPHIDQAYIKVLDSLPPDMRAALRHGSWDLFVGMVFQEWRRDIHTCEPFEIPSWWRRWGGIDLGQNDPGVFMCAAADQDGTIYIYREFSFDQHQANSVQARAVKSELGNDPVADGPWATAMDAFNVHRETGKGPVDYYAEGGLNGFVHCIHGPNSRAQRAMILHEYLKTFAVEQENGPPKVTAKLKIFSNCNKIIETLPTLVRDKNDREAVADSPVDHWYDCLCYLLAHWHVNKSKPPAKEAYKSGTAGDLLGHKKVWKPEGEKRKVFA